MNDPIVADIEFEAVGAGQVLQSNGPFNYAFVVRPLGSDVRVRYQVSSNSISVIDSGGSTWDWGTAHEAGKPFVGDDTYRMEHPSPSISGDVELGFSRLSVDGVRLSYLTSGYFSSGPLLDPNGVVESFLFGYLTPSGEMPKTGQASYSVAVFGGVASPSWASVYTLEGADAAFSANFLNGTVSTWIDAVGKSVDDPSVTLDLGRWNGSGTISSASAGFTGFMSIDGATSGQFAGAFFGPGAAEMGYFFEIEKTAFPEPYIGFGQVVGRKD